MKKLQTVDEPNWHIGQSGLCIFFVYLKSDECLSSDDLVIIIEAIILIKFTCVKEIQSET